VRLAKHKISSVKAHSHYPYSITDRDKRYAFSQELVNERVEIEKAFNIQKIDSFGTNYAEYYRDGKRGIEKILVEAQDFSQRKAAGEIPADQEYGGQVAGAFYREELGDIDVVFGDSTIGLKHIVEKNAVKGELDNFTGENLNEKISNAISEIVEKGEIVKNGDRAFIEYDKFNGVITLDYKGDNNRNWVLTIYENKNKTAPSTADSHQTRLNVATKETNLESINDKKSLAMIYESKP